MSTISAMSMVVLSQDLARLDVLGEVDVNNEPLKADEMLHQYGSYAVLMGGAQAQVWKDMVTKFAHPDAYFAVDQVDYALTYLGRFPDEENARLSVEESEDVQMKEGYWLVPMTLAQGWLP